MLELDNVAFAYPKSAHGYLFNVRVTAGEIVAVTGPSGCGKSTLLNLIAGFERPQSGQIRLDGKNITALPPQERDVSILFQADNLFEHLTTAGNLGLALPHLHKNSRIRKIAAALSDVELAGLDRQRADTLSGGQKQRVALARTLLLDRPVLLLDEPFSALDRPTAQKLRALLARLVGEHGWRTLMVSHDTNDLEIAHRHLVIKQGRLHPFVRREAED